MVDENLILIKKTPLTVAEVNQYGGDFINKYSQMYNGSAANMGGYGGIAYYTYDPNNNEYGGYNNFCIIKHNNSFVRTKDCFTYYYASDVNTLVSKWVSANFSESELIKDSFGSNYRILTDEDLVANFNYTLQPDNYTYKSTSAPSWLYNENYSYWMFSNQSRAIMRSDGTLEIYRSYDLDGNYEQFDDYEVSTVRPVISIKKEAIPSSNKTNLKSINSATFKSGDLIEYNGIKYYVLNNASKKTPVLKLLKETPLTVEDVNKYGKSINLYTSDSKGTAKNVSGYGGVAYYSRSKCRENASVSCSTNFITSDIYVIVKNWANAVTNEDDLYEDEDGYTARILNKEDILKHLSYSAATSSITSPSPTFLTPDFLLYLDNCWTMFNSSDGNEVYKISKNGYLVSSNLYDNNSVVCPVINFIRPGYEVVGSTNTGMSKPVIYTVIGIIISLVSCCLYFIERKISKNQHNL